MVKPVTKKLAGRWGEAILLVSIFLASFLRHSLAWAEESAVLTQFLPYRQGAPRIIGLEFSATLTRNPVNHALETFVGAIDIACEFSDQPAKKSQGPSLHQQLQKVRKQIQSFLDMANSEETIDLVSSAPLPTGHKAVITLEKEFLNDPTMSDLVDGQFKVVGKLVRVIPDSSDSVNLLRKRAVGSINQEILDQLFSALSGAAKQSNLTIPDIAYPIKGPVLQTLPVAVFA